MICKHIQKMGIERGFSRMRRIFADCIKVLLLKLIILYLCLSVFDRNAFLNAIRAYYNNEFLFLPDSTEQGFQFIR